MADNKYRYFVIIYQYHKIWHKEYCIGIGCYRSQNLQSLAKRLYRSPCLGKQVRTLHKSIQKGQNQKQSIRYPHLIS